MRCPKCGDKNVYIFVDDIHTGDAWWVCPSMCCDWRKPYLHPAVKLAFAGYQRALTMAWEQIIQLKSSRAQAKYERAAWAAARSARTLRRKAEGKEGGA